MAPAPAPGPAVPPGDPAGAGFARLDRPYAMIIHIPCYEDAEGALWLDRLWHHDLVEHLSYLPDFILCAPRRPRGAEPDLVRLDPPDGVRVRVVPLPRRATRLQALLGLPRTAAAVWRAVGLAGVVHTGIGGWPYPLGWLAVPAALLRRRKLVVGVESSWRHGFPGSETWLTRAYDRVADAVARFACRRADVSFYTQAAYRDTLHLGGRGPAYLNPAVWINEGDLLPAAAAEAAWAGKVGAPVRLAFAGRVTAHKGVDVLLAALRLLDARGVAVRVDVIGTGDRRAACEQLAAELRHVRVSVLDPVPYGAPFFELVRGYDAVVVPSLADEQPRIVFDAASQAVPVIASDTDGLRPHVDPGRTGWLVPPGDAAALSAALERAASSGAVLRQMGIAALAAARGVTHEEMHRHRSRFLAAALGSQPGRA